MPRFLFVLAVLAVCLNQAAARSSNNGAESGAKAKQVVDSISAPNADSLAVPVAKGDSAVVAPGTAAVGLKDPSVVPPPDTALAVGDGDSSKAAAALKTDSVKSSAAAPVAAGAAVVDSAAASSQDSSSLAATPDSAAEDSVSQGTPPPLAASPKAALKDSTGGVEWKTLSDSSSDSNYAVIPPSDATPKVTSSSSGFFPDIPPDRESRVLMYTGAGLAAVGLVAFLVFNSSTSKATASNNTGTDNGGGNVNPNAPSQKTMTIQWAP